MRGSIPWRVSLLAPLAAVLAVLSVLVTGSDVQASPDPRADAIQKVLDAKAPTEQIESGTICDVSSGYYYFGIKKFIGIPGVTISPEFVGHQTHDSSGAPTKPPFRNEKCRRVTWAASTGVKTRPDSIFGSIPLGRYVLDKVGGDTQSMGTAFTAFRAHFEPTPSGKAFIARYRYDNVTRRYADGQAVLHRDADGKWIAQF